MKIKNEFIVSSISGVNYAVPVGERSTEFKGMIKLIGIGEFLWKKLEGGIEMDALVDSVTENYDIDRATAERDVKAFCAKLSEAGVLAD